MVPIEISCDPWRRAYALVQPSQGRMINSPVVSNENGGAFRTAVWQNFVTKKRAKEFRL
jgi:hypothetical protein